MNDYELWSAKVSEAISSLIKKREECRKNLDYIGVILCNAQIEALESFNAGE